MTSSKRLSNPRNYSFLLLATLSLCTPVLAKKGGKGGGGDGGDGGGENPVPPIVTAPISYAETQLTWENAADVADPGFQGIWVAGVTSRGIAAGNIKRPPLSDDIPSDDVAAERIGSINAALVPGTDTLARDASGHLIKSETMVDLNRVFATALANLNSARKVKAPTEQDWRIAYGRRINEAGHLACQLIPVDEARRFANGDPDPVPSLLVVANLNDGSLTPVNPDNTSPNQDFLELNAHGDVLVTDREATGWTTRLYILNPATDSGDEASYTEAVLPDSVTRPSFNSNLDVSYSTEDTENGRFVVDRLFRTGSPDPIWERRGKDYDHFNFFHLGVAEDGSVYTAIDYFSGGQVSFPEIPYHVISATERTPLVDLTMEGNADGTPGWDNTPVLSRATTSGEEEIILRRYSDQPGSPTIDFVIYKPKFGARFQIIPSDDYKGDRIQNVVISAPAIDAASTPYDPESLPDSGSYHGGTVAFTSWDSTLNRVDSFILSPQ